MLINNIITLIMLDKIGLGLLSKALYSPVDSASFDVHGLSFCRAILSLGIF